MVEEVLEYNITIVKPVDSAELLEFNLVPKFAYLRFIGTGVVDVPL